MHEFLAKCFAILISLLLLAQAHFIRSIVGTYIFPASLMSLAWFFFTLVPLTVLIDVPINPLAMLYILACVSAFSVSALPFDWASALEANKSKTAEDHEKFDSTLMRTAFYLSSLSSIVVSTISVVTKEFALYDLIFNLLETSGQYAAMRGRGELEYDIWGVLSIFFTYATPLLGGLVSRRVEKDIGKWAFLFVAFAPSVYFMLTQSAKLILFFSVGFYVAALLLRKVYANELELLSWSTFKKLAGYSVLLLPLVAVSLLSREGYLGFVGVGELVPVLLFAINSYAFGQVYAFSDFFSYYAGMPSEWTYVNDLDSYGYYTFKSIFDMLGGAKYFPPGTFEDGYAYRDVVATNIYTIFRGLINDFGWLGTIGFMFASGLIAHAFFHRLLASRRSWVACGVFVISVVYIQGTYLFSIFMARYMYLLLTALVLLLWVNDKLSTSAREKPKAAPDCQSIP